MVRRPTTNP